MSRILGAGRWLRLEATGTGAAAWEASVVVCGALGLADVLVDSTIDGGGRWFANLVDDGAEDGRNLCTGDGMPLAAALFGGWGE